MPYKEIKLCPPDIQVGDRIQQVTYGNNPWKPTGARWNTVKKVRVVSDTHYTLITTDAYCKDYMTGWPRAVQRWVEEA